MHVMQSKLQAGDFEGMEEGFLPAIEGGAKDIAKHKEKLKGDWSAALGIFSRNQRDAVRKILGSEVVFIVLNLTKDCQKKRCQSRMGGGGEGVVDMFAKMFDLYEPAGDDEENAFNIIVTEEMTVEDVEKKVLEIVAKFK